VVQKGGVPVIDGDGDGDGEVDGVVDGVVDCDDGAVGGGGGAALGKSGVRTIRKKKLYMANITYYVETGD
jgi:hypothetical protein